MHLSLSPTVAAGTADGTLIPWRVTISDDSLSLRRGSETLPLGIAIDTDGDTIDDFDDNCILVINPGQLNSDGDGYGNACDAEGILTDLNGDGNDDVLLRNSNGSWFYYPMSGKTYIAGPHGLANITSNLAWQYQGSGDFNGDGNADVLLRHTNGSWFFYPMDGKT